MGSPSPLEVKGRGFAYDPLYRLGRAFLSARWSSLLRHPIAQTLSEGTGILARSPSSTPFGLDLGTD